MKKKHAYSSIMFIIICLAIPINILTGCVKDNDKTVESQNIIGESTAVLFTSQVLSVTSEDMLTPQELQKMKDITPEAIKGKDFKILKVRGYLKYVILIDGKVYILYTGGGIVVDIKYNEKFNYFIYTYSWGSGIYRSHISVFDLNKKKTIFTSKPFCDIDVALFETDKEGIYDIYSAGIVIGEDTYDLKIHIGKRIGVLRINDTEITCASFIDETRAKTDKELLEMVNEMMQPTKDYPNLSASSNPYDCIRAHQETYDRLVAGSGSVLDVFINELRNSTTFGLDKYLMASVCSEITGVGAEGIGWTTAIEWLELYDKNTILKANE